MVWLRHSGEKFNYSQDYEMSKLILISSPLSAERQLDVVFVHGLGGDPIKTWRSGPDENTSWPHWLALEFGTKIGVWSLGYAAAPSKWRRLKAVICGTQNSDAATAMTLPRRAENALDRLVHSGIGQRPVCFISHSLGGLLVKSILRKAADSLSAPERIQLLERCRGVIFLATPHHGSLLANLAYAIKFYFPTVSTLDLKHNDDHLMDLYEWYRAYAPRHQILTRSYYENKETNRVVIVVPRSSADPGVTGETARGPTPLDRDHLEISKPENRDDQAYIGSTHFIREILEYNAKCRKRPNDITASGRDDGPQAANAVESIRKEPILELVIGETRTLEQALEAVRFFNSQISSGKKARLIYIEEGSTHLFLEGSKETLSEIISLYMTGALQKMFSTSEAPESLTFQSAELIYDKIKLCKASLIVSLMENKAQGRSFFRANLSGANLGRTNLIKASLTMANLNGANLVEAKLIRAELDGASLQGTNLHSANLFEAYLSGADLRDANLVGATLVKANLIEAKCTNADLSGANLNGANLIEANLNGAKLAKANLSHATCYEADLIGADLSGANLRNATFYGAKLTGTDFTEANIESCKFGGENGLTEPQIIDMQRRGALFEDSPESGVLSLMR